MLEAVAGVAEGAGHPGHGLGPGLVPVVVTPGRVVLAGGAGDPGRLGEGAAAHATVAGVLSPDLIFSSSLRMPAKSASGRGGHPGT